MLYLLILHVLITLCCYLSGALFYRLFGSAERDILPPVSHYLISGLILLTAGAQILVLFAPMSALLSIAYLAALVLCWWLIDRERSTTIGHLRHWIASLSLGHWFSIGAAWLMVLMFNAGSTRMDDTDSYHIQMIKWIQEYGTVPGIVNLHERFGFNSSWFSSVSLFLFANKNPLSYTALNGTLSFWITVFLISRIRYSDLKNKFNPIIWTVVLIIAFACWPLIRANAATCNYDIISAFVIVVLFVHLFQEKTSNRYLIELLVWPVYLCTVRIINYPFLILSLYSLVLLIKQRNWRVCFKLTSVALILGLAFIARTFMLSGYPFYPAPFLDFISVDWKADNEMVEKLNDFIKYFNRVNVTYLPIEKTRSLDFPNWTVEWYKHLFDYDKPLLGTGVLGLILSVLFHRKLLKPLGIVAYLFVLVFLLQLISWFFVAPDPRFVYGVLLSGLFLLLIVASTFMSVNFPSKTITAFILSGIAVATIAYTGFKLINSTDLRNFVLPRALPSPPIKKSALQGLPLNIPEKLPFNWNPRCYGTDLPCLYIIEPRLEARGKKISDGFRLLK